jgi:transcriptional regulator with XRE-family HTH domain
MELQRIVGANVRQYRRAKRWTLERLATEVGVSRETIGKIERGVSAPLFETVEKIALALNTSPTSLFGAQSFPSGERGKVLREVHVVLANLNDKELASAYRLLSAFSKS